MIKKILFLFLILTLAFQVPSVKADDTNGNAPQYFSYLFHLYYDNGQLFADRDFQFNYDILASQYQPPTLTTDFPYRGDIINFTGEVGAHFVFDPRQGDGHFTSGKLAVAAPYVADGERAVFYDAQNNPLLTISVHQSSYCNDDGICNADNGEDSLSCPKDCKQALPAPPPVQNQSSDTGAGSIFQSLIYVGIGVAAVVGYWFMRRRRSGMSGGSSGSVKSNFTMPPSIQRPVPPAPPAPTVPPAPTQNPPSTPQPPANPQKPV